MASLDAIVCIFFAYYAVPRVQTRIAGATTPRLGAIQNCFLEKHLGNYQDNWAFGVGYDTLRYVQRDYGFLDIDSLYNHAASGSDSSLLYILATTGIFGLVIFSTGVFFRA